VYRRFCATNYFRLRENLSFTLLSSLALAFNSFSNLNLQPLDMESFLKLVATTEWWISVVVVGILINLASVAVQHVFPKAFSIVSKRWQTRNEEKTRYRTREIASISASSQELYFALLELSTLKSNVLFDYLQTLVFLAFAFLTRDTLPAVHSVTLVLAVLSVMQGLKDLIAHGQYSLIVLEAQIQYRKSSNSANS
jgi:hypothetical protein